MQASLSAKVERLIEERIRSGLYRTASEAIEDAFEALTERENFDQLRAELDRADQQLDGGDFAEYGPGDRQTLVDRINTGAQARRLKRD
jgi:putative addiction module CopG family antidote